tara:strand:- start:452 stop:793 length:342 start_codon:yes stop_codon:yes gene_type:complete
MITTVLTNRTNYQIELDELKQTWLEDLLHYLGADIEWLDSVDRGSAVDYFIQNDLEIIKHKSIDAIEVRHQGELVGEWAGPSFTMKEDEDGELYYEVEIEHWSVIEEDIEEDT